MTVSAETLAEGMFSRRDVTLMIGSTALAAAAPFAFARGDRAARRVLIAAPSNLGLRPLRPGHVPGAWRGPKVLEKAGMPASLAVADTIWMSRPRYEPGEAAGSRIRNGPELRLFSERLSQLVASTLRRQAFPIVIGGDCSIILGCLAGAGTTGEVGLVHVDGHSDFFHPGNYDASARLGSAAGMDLALATGRGEPLLSMWNGRALVMDRNVVQIGERDELDQDYAYRDIEGTCIGRLPVRTVQTLGVQTTVERTLAKLADASVPLWLHIDLDVLDQAVLPAVDSPGSPGLTFEELAELVGRFLKSRRLIGMDIAIYDPDLDPSGRHARAIVRCFQAAFYWSDT